MLQHADPQRNGAWRVNTGFTNWPESNGYYKYQWWGKIKPDGSYDFMAIGHHRQRIYISPPNRGVAVRFGISDEGVDAWEEILASVIAKVQ